jgi:hypothetical protein
VTCVLHEQVEPTEALPHDRNCASERGGVAQVTWHAHVSLGVRERGAHALQLALATREQRDPITLLRK